jgi:hypothetical protein
VEERVLTLRLAHPAWGPDRILFQLGREHERGQLVGDLPSRSAVYRCLVRHRLIQAQSRRRRRSDYKRWERSRPMALWQMDVMGGVYLADGSEVKVVTGIDDHSRYVVCARLVVRATARPVCDALRHALGVHGVPEQILTDNGKVFTGRGSAQGSVDQWCPTPWAAERRHKEIELAALSCPQLPAARNCSITLAGMRPRGLTATPFDAAHTRTARLSTGVGPLAVARSEERPARRALPT